MILEELKASLRGRVVIVGVGNAMRGDDRVGLLVLELLEGRTDAHCIDAGEVPENQIGPICALEPDVVLVVDAADVGAEPGSIAVIEEEDFGETSFASHNPSMVPFALFVRTETGARIVAVGIQPRTTTFDAPMSPEVEEAATLIANALAN